MTDENKKEYIKFSVLKEIEKRDVTPWKIQNGFTENPFEKIGVGRKNVYWAALGRFSEMKQHTINRMYDHFTSIDNQKYILRQFISKGSKESQKLAYQLAMELGITKLELCNESSWKEYHLSSGEQKKTKPLEKK